jgi:hypothetical protein
MSNTKILENILSEIKSFKEEIKEDIEEIKEDIEKIKTDLNSFKKEVKKEFFSIKEELKKFTTYTKIESKLYEKEITSWLYNYFIKIKFSMFFYIPTEEEFNRNLVRIKDNQNNKKSKNPNTLTDIDGIIIETNNYNEKDKCKIVNNIINTFNENESKQRKLYKTCINQETLKNIKEPFIYILHIIESKHSLDIKRIKNKIRQIINLKKIIDNENCPEYLLKFRNSEIYLYLATPTLNKNVFNFIKENKYKDPEMWKCDSKTINMSDLDFLEDKIKFISYGTYDYYIN